MIELKNVSKVYKSGSGKVKALDNVSLTFKDSGFVSILGESGSGKSTVLNVLSGMDKVSNGEVLIDGRNISKLFDGSLSSYKNNHIGFIFQEYNLINHLSAIENVMMPLILSGMSKARAEEKAIAMLTKVGLRKFAGRIPTELSGGQQQRVSIARALINSPKIIFCDEPTGALDTKTSIQVLDFIKELSKDVLIIMVTHNEELANKYSDRLITLSDGVVIEDNVVVENESKQNRGDLVLKDVKFPFSSMMKFVMNNIKKRKKRVFLTSFTAAIGLICIFFSTFLIDGFRDGINNGTNELIIDEINFYNSSGDKVADSVFDGIEEKHSEHLKVVENYNFNVELNINYEGKMYNTDNYVYSGVDGAEFFDRKNIYTGSYLEDKNDIVLHGATLVSLSLDKGYSTGIEEDLIGKEITLTFKNKSGTMVNKTLTIKGIIDGNQKNSEAYGSDLITEALSEELLAEGIELNGENTKSIKFLNNSFVDANKKAELYKSYEKIIMDIENEFGVVSTYDSTESDSQNMLTTIEVSIRGISFISIAVSTILIGLIIYTSVTERTKEIGILRAIGTKRGSIRNMFIIESSFVGLISSLVAVIFSVLLTLFIKMLLLNYGVNQANSMFNYQIPKILIMIGSSIAVTALIGVIPAYKASKIKTINALRSE